MIISKVSDNNRIVKNTMFLYVRMFFSMAVSLYTSRVVLQTLGVLDYGIWNVVAGVIIMFSFLNASMSGCTSRFLAYELGEKNWHKIQSIFSAALTIHIIIALVILFLGETIGLWFLQNKLVIPDDRIQAAYIIYQFSIISSIISILQVPYNAMIIANERMHVYAYIEILNVLLRLFVIYLLIIVKADKLIVYGFLMMIVSIFIFLTYYVYCRHKVKDCKFRLSLDKKTVIPMLSFSGWDLYGNASIVARTQGVNMLLNIFFTATMNASSGIATQVQSVVMSFASNILLAVRPQIIKSYAAGDNQRLIMFIKKVSIFTTLLLVFFTLPLLIEINFVLALWLKHPPIYAGVFCRYVLVFNVIANLSAVLVTGIHATNKIKRSSIINGTCYLLVLPLTYIAFRMGAKPYIPFGINVIAVILGMSQNMYALHKYVRDFSIRDYVQNVLLKIVGVSMVVFIIVIIVSIPFEPSFGRLLLVFLLNSILLFFFSYRFIFDKPDKAFIRQKIKQTFKK